MENLLRRLALLFYKQKVFLNAATFLQLGMAQMEEAGRSYHAIIFRFADSLPPAYVVFPTLENAQRFAVQTLEGHSKIFGEENMWTMEAKSNISTIYIFQGRIGLAIEITESNLAFFRRNPVVHEKDLETTLSRLAWIYIEAGQPDKAKYLNSEC
jgi:hypothetical protein